MRRHAAMLRPHLTEALARGPLVLNAVVLAEVSPLGAHAAVAGRPLLTRDPVRVATHTRGAKLIARDGT